MKIIKALTAIVLLCFFSAGASAKSVTINESDFGDEWPFTVSEGELHCTGNEVTFRTGGIAYAVNGTATSAGYQAIEPIWKFNIKMLEELAAALETTVEEVKKTSPLRVGIGPVLKTGLELCK